MLVRIRFGRSSHLEKKSHKNRGIALGVAALLTPAAALATVVGMWRIAADLNWASGFVISAGFFSHWQVWLGVAILLQFCARVLNRYGKNGQTAAS
jgi:hypothetical protein